MLFSVWCHLSRAPWFWGWHVDDRYCDSNLTDISTLLVEIYLSKLKPWSDLIELGRPNSVKNLVKALTIAFALIFLKSTVSGNLVDTHDSQQILVSRPCLRYWPLTATIFTHRTWLSLLPWISGRYIFTFSSSRQWLCDKTIIFKPHNILFLRHSQLFSRQLEIRWPFL